MTQLNALVVGGLGFIGGAIAQHLYEKGYTVTVCSRHEESVFRCRLEKPHLTATVCDGAFYLSLPADTFDLVVNAAAMKHVGFCEAQIQLSYNSNVRTASNVVGYTSLLAKKVQISTDKAVKPICVYGRHKRVAEEEFYRVGKQVLRLPNVWKSTGSLYHIIEHYKTTGKVFPLFDEDMARMFCNIEDVITAFDATIASPLALNVVVAQQTRIADILAINNVPYELVDKPDHERWHEDMFEESEKRMMRVHPATDVDFLVKENDDAAL